MPIPMITPEILASSKSLEDGWSLVELMAVRQQASTDGKSINYFWEFEGVQGPNSSEDNKGRRITNCVNTAGLANGIKEACNNYIGMLATLTELSADEVVGKSIDEQQLIGKQIWVEVIETISQGKSYKNFRAFSPKSVVPF